MIEADRTAFAENFINEWEEETGKDWATLSREEQFHLLTEAEKNYEADRIDMSVDAWRAQYE